MEPFKNQEIRLVLLGHTGSGKSSTGNTILGRHVFGSHVGKMSFTQTCQCEESYLDGIRVKVIDTPGLFDTERSNSEISQEIAECLILAAPGPHAFLFVISLRDRFPREAEEGIDRIVRKFGEDIYRHIVVVFTGQDALTGSLSQYLSDGIPNCLQELLRKCSNRCIAFNNEETELTQNNNQRQELLDIIKRIHGHYTQKVRCNFVQSCFSRLTTFIRRSLTSKRTLPLLVIGALSSLVFMYIFVYQAEKVADVQIKTFGDKQIEGSKNVSRTDYSNSTEIKKELRKIL